MKLFALVASALGLGHTAAQSTWQTPSDADVGAWRSDVLGAASTAKDIKTDACKVPEGTDLRKLGDPTQVSKHYSKLDDGNVRATYQFKFADGSMIYAGNSNAGQKGGDWQIYCFRAGSGAAVVTKPTHDQSDLDDAMITRLESIFKSVDKDGSGTITTGGAYTGLSQIFPASSIPDFENTLEKESIKAAGTDKVVDLDEFECVAKKLMNIQKVYAEFTQYDENGDLTMDRDELSDALVQYYFKEVAQPGLIQTAAAKAKVKSVVDDIIKHHDKDGDDAVSWQEFEMDAFMEQHYSDNGQCRTSSDPLKEKSIAVVDGLIKKFKGDNKEMTHSMWYQIVSILTEQAIDLANGDAPAPPLGCMQMNSGGQQQRPGGNTGTSTGTGTGPQRFGQNGGGRFGQTPEPGLLGGRRVLLARFLQGPRGGGNGGGNGQRPGGMTGRGSGNGGRPRGSGMGPPGGNNGGRTDGGDGGVSAEDRMTIMQALQALRQQADSNGDGMISDHEILDIFQGVKDHVSDDQFAGFLEAVDNLDGPVDCTTNTDCTSCTAVDNAGLCGWFAESSDTNDNPFGGFGKTASAAGTCKFVDRSVSVDANVDAASNSFQMETCSTQCKVSGGGGWNGGRGNNGGNNFRGAGGGK